MEKAGESLFHIVLSSQAEVICRDRHDYIFFENQIGASALKSSICILAYAVMSNHVHIAVACTDPAGLILRIKSGYTRYFNKKYCRTGQLITYTYREKVRGYLRQRIMISYILRNPMHHGVSETPFQYPFSSVSVYFPDALSPCLKMEAPWKDKAAVTGELDGSNPEKYITSRDGIKEIRLPTDNRGRVKLDYIVNAGMVEYLFRTARNFLHSMNRWNTEDWEREQINAKLTDGIVSLETSEPTCAHLKEEMRGYENGSFRIHMTDLELCLYIDRELLPQMKIPSYALVGYAHKERIVRMLKDRFRISTEQAMRCLGGL